MIGWNPRESEKLRRLLAKKPVELTKSISKRWSQTLLVFIGKIQKEQMTGRPGLKAKTGTLRRSWFPLVEIIKDSMDVVGKVFTDVKYAKVHQTGMDIAQPAHTRLNVNFKVNERGVHRFAKPGKANAAKKGVTFGSRTIHIPKRLRVIEEYQATAFPQMVDDVRQAMKEVTKK